MRLSKLLPARADQRTGSDSEASVLAGWHSTGSLGSVRGVSRTHDSGMLCNCTRLMESIVWSGNATGPAFRAPDVHPITSRAGNGPAETSFLPPFRVVPWQRIRTSSRKTFRFDIARTLALWSRPNGEGPLRNLSKIIFQAFPSDLFVSFSPYLPPISARPRAIHCSLAVYSPAGVRVNGFRRRFSPNRHRARGTLRATEPSSAKSSSECASSAGDGDSSRAL